MSSWCSEIDFEEGLPKVESSLDPYLIRLRASGEYFVGALCGDIYSHEAHWNGFIYEDCIGDGCPLCERGVRVMVRAMSNVFLDKENEMRVFDGPTSWVKNLGIILATCNPTNWLIRVERYAGPDQKWPTYLVGAAGRISDELKERIKLATLIDLAALIAPRKTDRRLELPDPGAMH